MASLELQRRTRVFALRVIDLVKELPVGRTGDVIGRRLLRCGTSVGANYRAACRARSRADFVAKMGVVEEEAHESIYWMELLVESRLARPERVATLLTEANELVAMTVSSIKTARQNKRRA
ncbi:MAG: four helix bundle protein [Deltaproteobacteria bacterium]|nr:four helix bundle protein [Deltaproteobacteria bacterium]MBI3388927.1 four helix bundle protein [Deltaproteobacteria bacterium]